MCIKKLFKNLSIAIALSIITTSSSVIPVFATNMCVSIDSNGNEIVEEVPEAIDEEEIEEQKKEERLEKLLGAKKFKERLDDLKRVRLDISNPFINKFYIIGDDDRKIVKNTKVKPYKCICYIATTFPNGDSCSGTGWICKDDVLVTAAHVLYKKECGGFFKDILVIPGRESDGNAPYGVIRISTNSQGVSTANGKRVAYVPSDYIDSKFMSDDYGVVKLPRAIGEKCGHIYTSYKDKYLTYPIQMAGYPGEKYPSMYTSDGEIIKYYDDVLFHDIDSTHGQSGAPILVQTITGNYTAIAIHNGGKKENESNRAVRTSDTVKDLILKAHHD